MRRRNVWIVTVVAAAALLTSLAVWHFEARERSYPDPARQLEEDRGAPSEALWPPTEETGVGSDAVVAIAAQYIGLTDLAQLYITVDRVVPEGDTTPFLSHLVNGRECYVVTFDNVEIRMPWANIETGEEMVIPIRTLKALMDAESGTLLRVWSTEWMDPPTMRRTALEVEQSISQLDEEEWVGFPDSIPSMSLLEAMYRYVLAASVEQLDAYYVTTNSLKGEGRATWQIIARQGEPFSHAGPEQEHPYPVYGFRFTVDGESGEPGYSCSIY
jgi:hypothetical protein